MCRASPTTYPHRFWAAGRMWRSTAAEMQTRAMRSRERGSQATDHRDLPGLGFTHQPLPIHLHQGIQPGAVGIVELAFAIAGEQVAQRFLVLAGHLHVTQAQDVFVREAVNGHIRRALINCDAAAVARPPGRARQVVAGTRWLTPQAGRGGGRWERMRRMQSPPGQGG